MSIKDEKFWLVQRNEDPGYQEPPIKVISETLNHVPEEGEIQEFCREHGLFGLVAVQSSYFLKIVKGWMVVEREPVEEITLTREVDDLDMD